MQLCILSGRPFEETFEKSQCRKVKQCNQCDYGSSRSCDLKTHLKTHSGEKPTKCNQCDYAFNQAGNLETHFKMHNGEKSDKCNLCASSRSWHLKNTLEKIPSSFSHSYFVVTILNGHLHIWPEILLSPDIVSLKDLLFMADVDIVNNQPCWPLLILRPINYKPNKPRLDTHLWGKKLKTE